MIDQQKKDEPIVHLVDAVAEAKEAIVDQSDDLEEENKFVYFT